MYRLSMYAHGAFAVNVSTTNRTINSALSCSLHRTLMEQLPTVLSVTGAQDYGTERNDRPKFIFFSDIK